MCRLFLGSLAHSVFRDTECHLPAQLPAQDHLENGRAGALSNLETVSPEKPALYMP